MKSLLASLIKHIGRYVKNSPRARRLVLGMLALFPWLSVKCRRLYLRSQLGAEQSALMFGLPADEVGDSDSLSRASLRDGINASQRTPLETHFHSYVERE